MTTVKNTYKLVVEKFTENELQSIKELFDKRGNWSEATDDAKYITFIYVYYIYNEYPSKYWNIQSNIISNIKFTSPKISNKDVFYNNFKKLFPEECAKYMPLQYNINPSNYQNINKKIFDDNKYWLAKLSSGLSGIGIQMFTNWEDYYSFFQNFYNKDGDKLLNISGIPSNKWVLSYYIKNPLLIKGYKFHLRVPLVYLLENNARGVGFVATKSMIFTAKKPYIQDDWNNKDIHDTHFKTSYSRTLEYPADLDFITAENINYIDYQIYDISRCVIEIINRTQSAVCWEGTKHCFYIIGMDILIDTDYRARILEINENAVIYNDNPNYKQDLVAGIIYNLVDPYFPPEHPMSDNGFFKKIGHHNTINTYDNKYKHKYQKYKQKYFKQKKKFQG